MGWRSVAVVLGCRMAFCSGGAGLCGAMAFFCGGAGLWGGVL